MPDHVSFPEWAEPMAATTLTPERFTGPEWIFERKFDPIRLLAIKRGYSLRLSRNRATQIRPAVAATIAGLSHQDLVLDGEMTWGSAGPGV